LHKDPARRFTSAEALAEDLRRFLDGELIQARPAGPLERGMKWARRRPAAAALTLMSGTAALTLAGFSLGVWHYQVFSTALVAETAAKHRAASLLYPTPALRAHTEWQDNPVRRSERLLDDANCPEALRHWEWSYLKRLCHAEERTLSGHTSLVRSLAYSPDS